MSQDRITQIRVKGMRVLEDVTLDLKGLTVLVGENGTGKSTLLDALEILRQAGKPGVDFAFDVLLQRHGGSQDLLRHRSQELAFEVVVEGGGPKIQYRVAFVPRGISFEIGREELDVYADPNAGEPLHALKRTESGLRIFDAREGKLKPVENAAESIGQKLAIGAFGLTAQPAILRLTEALRRIEHHVAFETRPLWQERELEIRRGPRWASLVERAEALSRHGDNLPSCFQEIRNRGSGAWERAIERAQLGLGHDLRDFKLRPVGRGEIELEVVFAGALDAPVPARALSEGQLSYLAFVALCELGTSRSLLVFDEPENHLHPAMLGRVVDMLGEVAQRCPVLVATHSDRLLDALPEPGESVVLCELDENRATILGRPNKLRLDKWLTQYRGLGSIRAEGFEAHVFETSNEGTSPGGSS